MSMVRREPATWSFTIFGQSFSLRADRSRCPERMGAVADVDPDDPVLALESYKEVISAEIRHADKQRWELVEDQLDLNAALELIAWIIGPFVRPISKSRSSDMARKALAESRWPS